MQTRHAALFLALVLLGSPATVFAKKQSVTQAVQPRELSLLRVNVTGQAYDYFRPWQKRAPFSKRALGAVLSALHTGMLILCVGNRFVVAERRGDHPQR